MFFKMPVNSGMGGVVSAGLQDSVARRKNTADRQQRTVFSFLPAF